MLKLQHKKGDPDRLDGRVTVYATIEIDPDDLLAMKHPIASAIHNGFLVAQGNFRDQTSLKDFLKSELGLSLDEDLADGLSDLVERMNGIESALDPQKLKDRLENMGDFEEFIPTPAKVVPFHSEQEILSQEGDVYYAGSFKNIGNAVLSVNAVPIVYQARYREQEMQVVRNEIESLISQIEQTDTAVIQPSSIPDEENYYGDSSIKERILKEFIPQMLYAKNDPPAFETAKNKLRGFLHDYRFPADIEAIITCIAAEKILDNKDSERIELLARKIDAVSREDFSAAEIFAASLNKLNSGRMDTNPGEHIG